MTTNENFVTWRKNSDRKLLQASREAQNTFREFWYQIALDFNRIIPALQIATLKVTFSDEFSNPDSEVEHMWVNEIDFDGVLIDGVLANAPLYLKSIEKGDRVSFTLDRIDDWLCVLMDEKVYGGYSIQVIRSEMSDRDREEHDRAWNLSFPPPDTVLVPERNQKFARTIANMMSEQIEKQPELINAIYDDRGRTLLHLESLCATRLVLIYLIWYISTSMVQLKC